MYLWKGFFVFNGIFFIFSFLSGCDMDEAFGHGYQMIENVEFERVVDGDTIIINMEDGTEERVRLLLIDTPESVDPDSEVEAFGEESSDYAQEYFEDVEKVTLEIGEKERDAYDRLLAHVWVGDENFNLHMVEEGFARVAYVSSPNTKYRYEFQDAENEAKEEGYNIWSIDGYVTDDGFDMSIVE